MTVAALPWDEIQSLLLSAFPWLPVARLVRLRVADADQARATLSAWVDAGITFGRVHSNSQAALQVAFSAPGLAALGVPPLALDAFPLPFQQGIASPHRSRILGDSGPSSPERWLWSDASHHAVLLAYAKDEAGVERLMANLPRQFTGWMPDGELRTAVVTDGEHLREHFGFRDGISQPQLAELRPRALDVVAAGEFILGYPDETGELPPSPHDGTFDFGRNGSYLVLRQLRQDVAAFWGWLRRKAGTSDVEAIWLAAKLVGRWPNGMPVANCPVGPEPPVPTTGLSALSFVGDTRGLGCPRGAHVRRANPREALAADAEVSRAAVRRHRLLRRGRSYGRPAPPECFPDGVTVTGADGVGSVGENRGLLFACLCADLARQFEFVQQTWLNNAKHDALFDEVDPIAPGADLTADERRYSIPREPIRRRLHDVPRAITVEGGAYLFLPGKETLRRIAAAGQAAPVSGALGTEGGNRR